MCSSVQVCSVILSSLESWLSDPGVGIGVLYVEAGGALAGGSCISYRGGAIGQLR
jgi:hypothetical protein